MTNFDELLAGGSSSAFNKSSAVGETVTGPIISATSRQVTDYVTKAPETWDNGDPKMQAVITIKTDLRADENDDGARSVYIKLWGLDKQALAQAVRDAGFTSANAALAAGNIFTATFTGTQPSKFGSDQKLYAYRIQKGATGLDTALQPQQAAAAPAAPTPSPFGAPQVAQYAAPQATQQPVQATVAPTYQQAAPAPTQAPVQAAPAAPAPGPTDVAGMIQAGYTDERITALTGTTPDVLAIIRANQPA